MRARVAYPQVSEEGVLRRGVERARGFVAEDDLRVLEDHARYGYALFFPAFTAWTSAGTYGRDQ